MTIKWLSCQGAPLQGCLHAANKKKFPLKYFPFFKLYTIFSTGWASLLVISMIWIHLTFNFFVPTNSQTYFLTKDFVTILIIFVIVPLLLIIRNKNMSKYVIQHISANQYYIMFAVMYNRCSALMPNKADRNNSVTPLPNIENMDFINENQRTIYI